jgi:KipI family sensor histidine kinase inhibitor
VIRDAGDSALVLELEPRIDPEVNARAIGIARAVRARALPGVRDVVSTYRSVAVFFDPLQTRIEDVGRALQEGAAAPPAREAPRAVEVPVAYGGTDGPDLADVAGRCGLTEPDVVRIHASATYRVFMLGFVPGFAYMGIVDGAIAMPRRATPRVRVPAGSVAIAGRQTGIYPQETPGGWQLIGRTRVRPFDPDRTPPFLVEAGDQVRFAPVPGLDRTGPPPARRVRPEDGAAHGLTVIAPGLLTTIQDLGRWGSQDRGVPVAGPMDVLSHRLANAAVGNPRDAATLEVTLLGPELRFDREAVLAISGADLGATLGGRPMDLNRAYHARRGDVLRFTGAGAGARAYVAVAGGILSPPVLGSRATHVLSEMGGVTGRPVAAGDRLPIAARGPGTDTAAGAAFQVRRTSVAARRGRARLRVLPGPQDDFFDPDALERLEAAVFTISPQSNRMGYRLSGASIPRLPDREMISDAMVFGGIQVPPSGEPILLMADRQTSGGYPQIATVITADLPIAGQLAPGDALEFRVCSRREAVAALIAQEGPLVGRG